ncbi:MAG: CapA family protein, partial [Planctomycetota bacterium]
MATTTLAFLGDVMLGRGVNKQIVRRSPESFWGDVLPVLRSADAVVANLECALTGIRSPWTATPKMFHFRAGPLAVAVLKAANIRCVSLANNHALDFGRDGLIETLSHLDEAGIAHAGAGRDEEDAAAPAVFDVGWLRVGVVGLTDNEPPFAASPGLPGTNYLEIAPRRAALRRVQSAVKAARDRDASLVVLSVHWGPNMTLQPRKAFREFAHAVLDMGVDLVHGHSAHVFHGVEIYRRQLILYDTGDFLDDYAIDPELRNDWSFVFLVDLEGSKAKRLRMVPVELEFAEVKLARGQVQEQIRQRMRTLC